MGPIATDGRAILPDSVTHVASLSQACRKLVASLSQVVSQACRKSCRESVRKSIDELISGSLGNDQILIQHPLQISLEAAAVYVRAQGFEILDTHCFVLEEVPKRLRLSLVEAVLLDEDVATDDLLASVAHLGHLGLKSGDEILEPTGHVHPVFTHALDRPVEGRSVAVVVFADSEQPLEVVPGFVKAEGGEETRGAAVAIQERVDVHQLELGDAAHQYRMDIEIGVQPLHQFGHHHRHLHRSRWCVDDFFRAGVDDVVLDATIISWRRAAATHTFDQFAVNLPDHPFGNGITAVQAFGDELEGAAVIEQLPCIVRISIRHGFSLPETRGLIQRQLGAFDMSSVMRLQHQSLLTDFSHPIVRKLRRFQETPRPLNASNRLGHAVGDGEPWLEIQIRIPLVELFHRKIDLVGGNSNMESWNGIVSVENNG